MRMGKSYIYIYIERERPAGVLTSGHYILCVCVACSISLIVLTQCGVPPYSLVPSNKTERGGGGGGGGGGKTESQATPYFARPVKYKQVRKRRSPHR